MEFLTFLKVCVFHLLKRKEHTCQGLYYPKSFRFSKGINFFEIICLYFLVKMQKSSVSCRGFSRLA